MFVKCHVCGWRFSGCPSMAHSGLWVRVLGQNSRWGVEIRVSIYATATIVGLIQRRRSPLICRCHTPVAPEVPNPTGPKGNLLVVAHLILSGGEVDYEAYPCIPRDLRPVKRNSFPDGFPFREIRTSLRRTSLSPRTYNNVRVSYYTLFG